MAILGFTWDPAKARANPDHSEAEERFILLGLSAALRMLVVVHAYREGRAVIRIISARKATLVERAAYDRGGRP